MRKNKNSIKKKYKNYKKIFVYAQILILALIIVLFLYYKTGNINPYVITEIEETNESLIIDYLITELNYSEGLQKEILFPLYNINHRNMKVLLDSSGDLNDSIYFKEKILDFFASEEKKDIYYTIKLERALEPGLHIAQIIALEIPNAEADGGYRGSVSRKVAEIRIYVPYPGKYLDADFEILNAEQNSTSTINIPIVNRGRVRIDNAKAIVDIYTLLDEKISSFETNSISVEPYQKSILSSEWKVNALPGDYIAKVKIDYDEESKNFEKKFSIGAKNLTILGILANSFQLGEIAKLQILVENNWNRDLSIVFANLIVLNKEGQIIVDIKSSSEKIAALSKKELIAYWDTAGLSEGDYNGKLIVNYQDKTAEKSIVLRVSQDSLEVFGVGYAIRPNPSNKSSLVLLLIILVVILMVVNLSWFLFFRRIIFSNKEIA